MGEDVLKARLLRELAVRPSPTRAEGRHRLALLLVASTSLAFVVFWALDGPAEDWKRPTSLTWLIGGGWALVACGLTVLALVRRAGAPFGRRPAVALALALATPLLVFAWVHAFHGRYVEPYERFGWRCLAYTFALSALPLGGLLVLLRGREPRGPGSLGAALGAVCGAWASAFVDLWCPLTNASHVVVGHALPVAILVLLGGLLGQRWLGPVSLEPRAE